MCITPCFSTLMFNNHFIAQSVSSAPAAAPHSQPHFSLFWVILCHQQNLLLHYSPHFPRSLCHWSLSEPADTSLCCDRCQLILPLCSLPLTSYQTVGEISHYSVRAEFLRSLAEESFSKPFANTSARSRSAHHFWATDAITDASDPITRSVLAFLILVCLTTNSVCCFSWFIWCQNQIQWPVLSNNYVLT